MALEWLYYLKNNQSQYALITSMEWIVWLVIQNFHIQTCPQQNQTTYFKASWIRIYRENCYDWQSRVHWDRRNKLKLIKWQ